MVLVLLGTQKQQFTRILELTEDAKILKDEEIIVQAGNTIYKSDRLKILDFISLEQYEELIRKTDLLICHGGVGTIFSALKAKKKILVVPRLKKYGEHINDHQLEICQMLENMGYLNYYKDGEDFEKALQITLNKGFKEYISDESFLDILRKEI